MKQNKRLLFLLPAVIALLAAIFMFIENGSLGFPDGHLTELDLAMRIFYKIIIPVFLFFAVIFLFFSWSERFNKRIRIIFLYCFGIIIAASVMICYYLANTLDNGIGG